MRDWSSDVCSPIWVVVVTLLLPTDVRTAEFAALKIGEKMGLTDCVAIHKQAMHPCEGALIELKGVVGFDIDTDELVIPKLPEVLSAKEIRDYIHERPITVVAATVGEDEHSVGLKEILDIKHRFFIAYFTVSPVCSQNSM